MSFKLNHLHLKSSDPDKAAKFYVDNLGARIVSSTSNGGYRLDLHGLSINLTGFIKHHKREQKFGMEHIAIDTDDFDSVIAALKDRGVKILEQTATNYGGKACFFEGPDGVQIEFLSK
jgi:catechol 2,3-dioxygenase-like lactoylglutathione lyase family enzyme